MCYSALLWPSSGHISCPFVQQQCSNSLGMPHSLILACKHFFVLPLQHGVQRAAETLGNTYFVMLCFPPQVQPVCSTVNGLVVYIMVFPTIMYGLSLHYS